MNEENARRLAEREELERSKISIADVETYRELHFPGSIAKRDAFVARGGVEIPGDGYITKMPHWRFHEWFGTVCDDTCPHIRHELPAVRVRRPWWRFW